MFSCRTEILNQFFFDLIITIITLSSQLHHHQYYMMIIVVIIEDDRSVVISIITPSPAPCQLPPDRTQHPHHRGGMRNIKNGHNIALGVAMLTMLTMLQCCNVDNVDNVEIVDKVDNTLDISLPASTWPDTASASEAFLDKTFHDYNLFFFLVMKFWRDS